MIQYLFSSQCRQFNLLCGIRHLTQWPNEPTLSWKRRCSYRCLLKVMASGFLPSVLMDPYEAETESLSAHFICPTHFCLKVSSFSFVVGSLKKKRKKTVGLGKMHLRYMADYFLKIQIDTWQLRVTVEIIRSYVLQYSTVYKMIRRTWTATVLPAMVKQTGQLCLF